MCYTYVTVGEDMEGTLFINEAIHKAISDYLKFRNYPSRGEFQSFLVMVVRTLTLIYGELDIENPFRTNSERGFDINLKKFGLSDEMLKDFKNQMQIYFQNENNILVSKDAFIVLQKILIEMFMLRKSQVTVTSEETTKFKELLYTRNDSIPSKVYFYNKYTPNSDEIIQYFNSKLFESQHQFVFTEYKDIALSAEAYQLAGFNAVEVMNMKEEEILNINNKVYHFFRSKDTDLNKRNRLQDAISYYKKYGNTITTGNGYVDFLLLLSFIATGLMLLVLIGVQFMR